MDHKSIMLSEISQMKKQEQYDFTYMYDIKQKATNEQIKQINKFIGANNSIVLSKGEGIGGG